MSAPSRFVPLAAHEVELAEALADGLEQIGLEPACPAGWSLSEPEEELRDARRDSVAKLAFLQHVEADPNEIEPPPQLGIDYLALGAEIARRHVARDGYRRWDLSSTGGTGVSTYCEDCLDWHTGASREELCELLDEMHPREPDPDRDGDLWRDRR